MVEKFNTLKHSFTRTFARSSWLPQDRTGSQRAIRDLSVLSGIVLLTRLPFLGIGEPDSALFAMGVQQWLRGGPQALGIYSSDVCGSYYAAIVWVARQLHLTQQSCVTFMSLISAVACLGIVLIGYLLGKMLVGPNGAFKGMLLFSLSPGLWWTTVEPHPQAISFFFAMLGLWVFACYIENTNPLAVILSAFSFAVAISLKNDSMFLLPALLGIVVCLKPNWRNAITAVIIGAAAGAMALGLAQLAVGSASRALSAGATRLSIWFRIPGPVTLVKQIAPIVFGLGLVTSIALGAVLVVALVKRSESWRRWFLIASWCLPGYLFFLLIGGNNVRHVVAFGVPLFLVAGNKLKMRYVVLCLILSLLVPGNSNMFLFPSPNVLASMRLFAHKKDRLAAVAAELSRQSSCYIGSYTNDYLANALLQRGGYIAKADPSMSNLSITMPNDAVIALRRVDPQQDKSVQIDPCRSLEYGRDGKKVRFIGDEWRAPVL
jgi:hypothetical protein